MVKLGDYPIINTSKNCRKIIGRHQQPKVSARAYRSYIAEQTQIRQMETPLVQITGQCVRIDRRPLLHRRAGWVNTVKYNHKGYRATAKIKYNKAGINRFFWPKLTRVTPMTEDQILTEKYQP